MHNKGILYKFKEDNTDEKKLKDLLVFLDDDGLSLGDSQKEAFTKFLDRGTARQLSSATKRDCEVLFGMDFRNLDDTRATLYVPEDFPAPSPSYELCAVLDKIRRRVELDTEAACRLIINEILLEVIDEAADAGANVWGFFEVPNGWTGNAFTGFTDYMIGSKLKVGELDSMLLVVEAKLEWPRKAVWQVLIEAGCHLKTRMGAGKNTPVFAVLSNGTLFQFFAIDTDMRSLPQSSNF